MDGTDIYDFLSRRVGDVLVSELPDSQSDQNDRYYDLWSHRTSRFLLLGFGLAEVYVKKPDKVKSLFSGFAELGHSLFVSVTQILHGRFDT